MESMNRGSSTVMYHNNEEKQKNEDPKIGSPKSVEYKELKLKLQKKVTWTEDTIDNEHMNKKKSKSKNYLFLYNKITLKIFKFVASLKSPA
jgi:hypothetical protein